MSSFALTVMALAVTASFFPRLDAAELTLTFTDSQSRPLRDVETRLVPRSDSPESNSPESKKGSQYKKTDKAGNVRFAYIEPGDYLFQAQKKNYTSLRLVLRLREDDTRTQVLLRASEFEEIEEQAAALGKEGRAPEAIEALQGLLRHYPEDGLLHNRLAFHYAELGDAERALAEARRAADYDPQFASSPNQVERILLRTAAQQALQARDFAAAIKKFEALTRADASDPAGYHGLALAYGHTGRHKEALEMIAKAIELDPGNEALQQIRTILTINSDAQ
jgi:tetratricopeptide (TPR) repeat protein